MGIRVDYNDWNDHQDDGRKNNRNIRNKNNSNNIVKSIFEWIIYIGIIILSVYLITTFVVIRTDVSGESMENTLHDKDSLLVEKVTYYFNDPERFDIIVFPYQHDTDVFYIKRIIGLPGETVQIIDGYVYIDGELLEEDVYGKEVIANAGLAHEPILLGPGEYFVLGDNRNHSSDSRSVDVGNIRRNNIEGQAWLRIWPFNDFGVVENE